MKWYDYILIFIVADVVTASIFSMNFLTLTIGVVYWIYYETMRKTGWL